MGDLIWQESDLGHFHAAISALVEPTGPAAIPRTDALIGHMIDQCRKAGDDRAVDRVAAISVTVEMLRHALRAGAPDHYAIARLELARLTEEWLAAAPMFPDLSTAPARAAARH